MKKKEKTTLIETPTFETADAAETLRNKEKIWLTISLIAAAVALIPSVIIPYGMAFAKEDSFFRTQAADYVAIPCFIIGLVCCALCLGFFGVFKFFGKTVKWSWLLIPVFPIDLIAAVFAIPIALIMLFITPVIPCLFGVWQRKKNLDAANAFLMMQ